MKVSITIIAALVAACFAAPLEVQNQFSQWAADHKRSYATEKERQTRLENFYVNLLKVADLNNAEAHRAEGAMFKLNKFADWSAAELRALRGVRGLPAKNSTGAREIRFSSGQRAGIPSSYNWVDQGKVAPIQDQGQCGSCWAFSATSNVESVVAIKANASPIKLSEQFLVDCDQECGTYRFENGCDAGCNGGLQPNAFKFVIKNNGQPSESSYPYQGVDGSCQKARPVSTISNWEFASENEDDIATYVATKAPLSIAVDAENWSFYSGGIMSSSSVCPTINDPANQLDHGVNIVGYGTSINGIPYWVIRNSWSSDWGENGYGRIIRGKGFCGVNLFACSSIA